MSKLVLNPLTVFMTPTQFGPTMRISAERRLSTMSRSRLVPSGVLISPKPADMHTTAATSLKRFFLSANSFATDTAISDETISAQASTGSGISSTLL